MEDHNGLVIDIETTQATGKAEREATLKMATRTIRAGGTLSAGKGYDTADFLQSRRELETAPPVAVKVSESADDDGTTQHADYAISLKKRKLIEEIIDRRLSAT